LKYCVVAGEPLNPEVYPQFLEATGIKLIEGYGQTECTVALATYSWMEPKPGSMGKPSPGYQIYLVDDDVIKSSGYRIGPFEVESALMEHPAVMECAITAVPDPDRGQVVKATIILSKSYQASDELAKELQEHVKKVTVPYKYPRIIEFVSELPKTISGKIRRVQIRDEDRK